MKGKLKIAMIKTAIILFAGGFVLYAFQPANNNTGKILSFEPDPKKQDLELYWKNDKGEIFGSIKNLKSYVESKNKHLVFAMNGGMYRTDQSPQGLFIEDYKLKAPLDTLSGEGNFYLKPNGVFYIAAQKAHVCKTQDFKNNSAVKYATQSGPMLVINGVINPQFTKGSKNLNIRNGVGILPNGNSVFAMSQTGISFYDFADYFKKLGCKNALYLDGFVSRTYLPQKNHIQTDGSFGVIIGVTD